MEQASPAALAQFTRQARDHNIPYWGPNCIVRVLDLADGELRDVPIGALLALQTLPFRVSYPVLTLAQLAFHDCIYCPLINFPEDGGNPLYEFHFHLAPVSESRPPSDAKSSSSSSVAESSRRSLASSSSVVKPQLSSR
jgi:hypothetical protein